MFRPGGITAHDFLRRYWQKKFYLAPQAFSRFENFIDRARAIALACRDDVESRLVVRRGRRWDVEYGPFPPARFKELPAKNWTLLIQGLNLHLAEADALLRQFDFVPWFRLDDMMASYAVPGGGVGPHFDSYDVFLLQGKGARLWQISRLRDTMFVPDAPLKLLQNFSADRQMRVTAGDVLYLPPRIAHNGIALEECVTYSIGFRAPSTQELAANFLRYLEETLELEGEYRDPEIKVQQEPGKISDAALMKAQRMLEKVKWNRRDVEDFFGRYLTEPKPHVFFSPPGKQLTRFEFRRRCEKYGVALELKTQMLYRKARVFINGETALASEALIELANKRRLSPPLSLDKQTRELLYSWYIAGYLKIDDRAVEKIAQRRC
jgi:50S ribosomal protein L16 3-hydroxylase